MLLNSFSFWLCLHTICYIVSWIIYVIITICAYMLSYCLGYEIILSILAIFSSFPQSFFSTFLQLCCLTGLLSSCPPVLLACYSSLLDCIRSRFRGHYTTSPQTVLQCMTNGGIYSWLLIHLLVPCQCYCYYCGCLFIACYCLPYCTPY